MVRLVVTLLSTNQEVLEQARKYLEHISDIVYYLRTSYHLVYILKRELRDNNSSIICGGENV